MRLYGRIKRYTKKLREGIRVRDGRTELVVTQKGTRDPLIRVIRHDKNVSRHEERLLVTWDEERCGEIRAKVSRVSTS